jgi:hypothetical protein
MIEEENILEAAVGSMMIEQETINGSPRVTMTLGAVILRGMTGG